MSKSKGSGLSLGSIIAIGLIMALAVMAFFSVKESDVGENESTSVTDSVSEEKDAHLKRQVTELQEELQEVRQRETRASYSSSANGSSGERSRLQQKIGDLEEQTHSLTRNLQEARRVKEATPSATRKLERTVEELEKERNKRALDRRTQELEIEFKKRNKKELF